MTTKNKLQHGGSRKGASRPRIKAALQVRRNITLDNELAAFAKEIGGGNTSNGIRIALEFIKNST